MAQLNEPVITGMLHRQIAGLRQKHFRLQVIVARRRVQRRQRNQQICAVTGGIGQFVPVQIPHQNSRLTAASEPIIRKAQMRRGQKIQN